MAVACLKKLKVGVVVTVEAIVVSFMASVSHDEIAMFLGENHIALRIELELQRLTLFMTRGTIEAGRISPRGDQFPGRQARCRDVREDWIDQRNALRTRSAPP